MSQATAEQTSTMDLLSALQAIDLNQPYDFDIIKIREIQEGEVVIGTLSETAQKAMRLSHTAKTAEVKFKEKLDEEKDAHMALHGVPGHTITECRDYHRDLHIKSKEYSRLKEYSELTENIFFDIVEFETPGALGKDITIRSGNKIVISETENDEETIDHFNLLADLLEELEGTVGKKFTKKKA